ncbi:MAG: alpha/beta hydrolase, partial [Planctomycetes bacterium]|nr:alpha/beta hydrolase [Planctomycetota bacterium]
MPEKFPFEQEEVAVLPTVGLDLSPGGREVRCFVKAPSQGINEDTGTLLVLHGLGGRHNDISYKKLRRDFADRFNLVVIGVNYLGTDVQVRDQAYIYEKNRAIVQENKAEILALDEQLTKPAVVTLDPEHYFYAPNPIGERELAKPLADDFWDYGCLQAMDVLTALHWVHQKLGVHQKLAFEGATFNQARTHLIAQSAGSQTAVMCLKFAPKTFSSLIDVGGIYFGQHNSHALHALLTDSTGRIHKDHLQNTATTVSPRLRIIVSQRNPVGHSTTTSRTGAALGDELAIRDVFRADHFRHWQDKRVQILSLYGCDDHFISSDIREAVQSFWRARGANTQSRIIVEADVDGVVIEDTFHEF